MINLLPPQQKKELLYEQKYKLFLIFGVLAVIFLIAIFLTFFAIKINISSESQREKIVISPQAQDSEAKILEINNDLHDLASFYGNRPDFTKIIGEILEIIPPKISLVSLSLDFSKKTEDFSASLRGLSPDREYLSLFKKNLESDSSFNDINFPPSTWVKPKDIEFNIIFKVKYEH